MSTKSAFFSHAVHGAWKEAEERKVTLPEDDPEVFSLYFNAVYSDKIRTVSSENNDRSVEGHLQLAKLYVLAEKLVDTHTQKILQFEH